MKLTSLNKSVVLPVDEVLVNNLINYYLSISHKDLQNDKLNLGKLLYNKINIINDNSFSKYNKKDIDMLLSEIREDYSKAGKPYMLVSHDSSNPLALEDTWNTFQSWNLLGTDVIKKKDLIHAFYFSIINNRLYELVKVLYDELKQEKIPFYFKSDYNGNIERKDNIILYASSFYFEKTTSVLTRIEKNYPDLIKYCNSPSLLMGKFSEKIGYFSNDFKVNYFEKICSIFINSVGEAGNDFILSNTKYSLLCEEQFEKYKLIDNNLNKSVKSKIIFLTCMNDIDYRKLLLNVFKKNLIDNNFDVNNLCLNCAVKKEIKEQECITLPNGSIYSKDEYIKKFNVDYWVPFDALVILKNGKELTGEEFIKHLLWNAKKYNTFQELFLSYNARVIRNNK